jgi:phage repressor protein C with HTH and peptisase S24 domain
MRLSSPIIIRRVQGHSMVPVLPPNTLVVGWAWTKTYKAGDIVIFEHEGKEKIKRVQEVLGDGSLFLVGEHPETSTDSRHFGAVDPNLVRARIIWPTPNPQ